jgi:ketosteroid isomerase-like protein
MSQENVELVKRMYALFEAGDAEGTLACFSEDVVVEAPDRPDLTDGRGREALGTLVGSWVESWEDWSQEIDEVREFGDHVMVISTQRGRAKSSGIEIAAQYAYLYEVRNGELSRMGMYSSPDEALEAAGLSE